MCGVYRGAMLKEHELNKVLFQAITGRSTLRGLQRIGREHLLLVQNFSLQTCRSRSTSPLWMVCTMSRPVETIGQTSRRAVQLGA